MNAPVSFKLAKLLKDKGYNEPCSIVTILRNKYNLVSSATKTIISGIPYTTCINKELPDKVYSAPSIAEVVMWFYEKHGIWIIVDCDCYGIEWFSKLSVASEKVWQDLDKRHKIISASKKIEIYTSPTEAYEAAIEYCLINL